MDYSFVGDGVFAESVPNHFGRYFDGCEFFAVVDVYGEADHFGEYEHVAAMCFDGFLELLTRFEEFFGFADFEEKL